MKARIERTSSYDNPQYKDFATLEELLQFKKEVGYDLIIQSPYNWHNDEPHDFDIEIYDCYRE